MPKKKQKQYQYTDTNLAASGWKDRTKGQKTKTTRKIGIILTTAL